MGFCRIRRLLFLGIIIAQTLETDAVCTEGKFGTSCDKTCHCSGGDSNCNDNGCFQMLCEFGYQIPPGCQKQCDQGFFGESCLLECHCPTNDKCSIINGQCESGKCNANYGGPGCQTHLPMMKIPPSVLELKCDTVTLIWRKWNPTDDLGDNPVGWYKILYKDSLNSAGESVLIPEPQDTANITWSKNGLKKGVSYTFQILAYRKEFNRPVKGLTGPESQPITPICAALQPGEMRSISFQIKGPDSLILKWQEPSVNTEDVIGYVIKYSRTTTPEVVGTCNSTFNGPEMSMVLAKSVKEVTLTGLSPWSIYSIEAYAQGRDNIAGVKKTLTTTVTDEAAPTARVRNIRVLQKSTSMIDIVWDEPDCLGQNGKFKEYNIRISNNAAATIKLITAKYKQSGLQANTEYTFDIRFVNTVGVGPYTQFKQRTESDTSPPGAVADPVVDGNTVTGTEITIQWKKPVEQGDTVTGYTVIYTKIGTGDCDNTIGQAKTVKISSTQLFVKLNLLQPWSKYEVIIYATGINNKDGPSKKMTTQTKSTVPTGGVRNLRVATRTSTELGIIWDAPECLRRNGPFKNYRIRLREGATILRDDPNLTSPKFSQNGLNAYTEYTIEVYYVNDIGGGPATADKFTTDESVPSAPQNLVATALDASSVQLQWSLPSTPNGQLFRYKVTIMKGGSNFRQDEKDVIDPSSTFTTTKVTNLQPQTIYSFKLQARTSKGGYGQESNVAQATTGQSGSPSAPTDLQRVSRSDKNIKIKWNPPSQPNGIIQDFQLTINYISSLASGAPTKSETVTVKRELTEHIATNLYPASKYEFSVRARTNVYGPFVKEQYWTEVGTPPVPDTPAVLKTTQSTIELSLKPGNNAKGPITAYYLIANVKTANKRRKRATNDRIAAKLLPSFFENNNKNFIVGDGKTYNGYTNDKLTQDTLYEIGYRVESSNDGSTKSETLWMSPITSKSVAVVDNSWIYYIVIAVILILIIIAVIVAVVIICIRRRQTKSDFNKTWLNNYSVNLDKFNTTTHNVLPYGKWDEINDIGQPRHVLHMTEPIKYPDPNSITLETEYHRLPKDIQGSMLAAQRPENHHKNRFHEFLAYDHSRVKIIYPHQKSDYINANYIHGYNKQQAYIAAQSPFNTDTVNDFWKMIYQENVAKIVFLAEPVEQGVFKCEQYWPDEGTHTYGTCYVHIISAQQFAHYNVKTFEVYTQGQSKKTVRHYHFTGWPPHAVPSDPIPFLEFIEKVNVDDVEDIGVDPVLVHAGTGVSRSAVFIAIDSMLKMAATENGNVNVYNFCCKIRQNRYGMVRTQKHYFFIYDALFEALIITPNYVDVDMRAAYKSLIKRNNISGHSYLLDQYKILSYYTPELSEEHCRGAVRAQNKMKNRFQSIIPPDKYRVILKTPGGLGRTDYVNALYADSHTNLQAYVITQTPLEETVVDFWRLVYDSGVRTIVMLHDRTYKEDSVAEYWPAETDTPERFGPLFVTLKTVVKEKDLVLSRRIHLSDSQKPSQQPREIKQFQFYGEWHMYDKVPLKRDGILQLLDAVVHHRNHHTTGPILVHCVDGASRSGLFCVLMNLIEKMEIDEYANIFHTIKHLKRRRPQTVNDFEMFKFVFKTLWDYINIHMKATLFNSKYYKATDNNYRLSSTNSLDYNKSNGNLATLKNRIDYYI